MHRHLIAALTLSSFLVPLVADAQVIGTFRWRTEPYCNILTLTVTQNGSYFLLDGFDEQCGGNPNLPVHGIGVPQPNGMITFGLSVVNSPGSPLPVNLEATISPATGGGTWRDSVGSSGAFAFNPQGTSGGPRIGAISPGTPTTIPTSFSLLIDGGFRAEGVLGTGNIPDSGPGTRMMWHPRKAAFRAGQVTLPLWDDANIGLHSAAFGLDTAAVGSWSVAFGNGSSTSGAAAFAAGYGSSANGFASIAMGDGVFASAPGSVALGSFANIAHEGTFVWGDRSSLSAVTSLGPNMFIVRSGGGARFFSSPVTTGSNPPGVVLASGGGSWISNSDVNMKGLFRDLDGEDVLSKLARMPIREWSYKSQDESIRHAGPTSQDFQAAFGLGETPLGINSIDVDGIALRAIQALETRTSELRGENEVLRTALDDLRRELDTLKRRE